MPIRGVATVQYLEGLGLANETTSDAVVQISHMVSLVLQHNENHVALRFED